MSNGAWIILTGALVAASCGLLGCFLILRRMAMLGDAISHAVLPGIVVAFLLTESRASLPMFLGAVAIGCLTSALVQALAAGGVHGDAAIGVTFTSLFALGVVLISRFAGSVDLDLDCVLYGDITYAPLDVVTFGGRSWGPRAVWVNGALLALDLLVLGLFYKELKLCAFDPAMAAAVGIPVGAMHFLLMGLVSVTTVGAFESVGAILVVAMLIVPGATAYLLTESLSRMLALSVVMGALASALGYWASHVLNCSPAGAMAAAAGALFALAFLFSPRHGVLARVLARVRLRRRVAEEDLLLWTARRMEADGAAVFALPEAARALGAPARRAAATVAGLVRAGLLRREGPSYRLTESGRERALALLRHHRLYETYLDELGYPPDHLHAPADRVEHFLTPQLATAVDAAARHPERDPQGKPIPPEGAAGPPI